MEDALECDQHQSKRRKIGIATEDLNDNASEISSQSARPISPPASRPARHAARPLAHTRPTPNTPGTKVVPSPIRLTRIRDLPDSCNNGTVTLQDLLGNPLMKACWVFDYLFDIPFLMSAFDRDVRHLVQVKCVHGFWRPEEKQSLLSQAADFPNVQLITAYMPEAFGTHHSKMMILFHHDETAQVIIHTANMISRDWTNLCQAVWCSPLLSLGSWGSDGESDLKNASLGSGQRFKHDLLMYLNAYGKTRTGTLVTELGKYDMMMVKAALVASVPGKHKSSSTWPSHEGSWGWPRLRYVLSHIPSRKLKDKCSRIIVQISSIATLGQKDTWLKNFLRVLSTTDTEAPDAKKPQYNILFPTSDEIRRSLDGYNAGQSIHTKTASSAQQKQLEYLRPMLSYWAADGDGLANHGNTDKSHREAGRRSAAPHIKTYIRFGDEDAMDTIDWAMLTSANLSTQAWGALPNAAHEVRICSWEIGVVLWPDLFATDQKASIEPRSSNSLDHGREKKDRVDTEHACVMLPTFKENTPDASEAKPNISVVGLRMPYDLPLKKYGPGELPWVATAEHLQPDWKGQVWRP